MVLKIIFCNTGSNLNFKNVLKLSNDENVNTLLWKLQSNERSTLFITYFKVRGKRGIMEFSKWILFVFIHKDGCENFHYWATTKYLAINIHKIFHPLVLKWLLGFRLPKFLLSWEKICSLTLTVHNSSSGWYVKTTNTIFVMLNSAKAICSIMTFSKI